MLFLCGASQQHQARIRLPHPRHGIVPKEGQGTVPSRSRIEGNNFDIGQLEQLSTKDKQDMLFELVGFIMVEKFETINDFTTAALREFPEQYREIIVGYNSILERYCRGNYLNAERKRKARETARAEK